MLVERYDQLMRTADIAIDSPRSWQQEIMSMQERSEWQKIIETTIGLSMQKSLSSWLNFR